MATSGIMYVKSLIDVVREQYSLKYALHVSSWRLKCHSSQKNSMGIGRENIVPGNLCVMKANVRYRQKTIFSIKNYSPIQLFTYDI